MTDGGKNAVNKKQLKKGKNKPLEEKPERVGETGGRAQADGVTEAMRGGKFISVC